MNRSCTYLKSSRHGIWYLRVVVPKCLRSIVGRRELIRSYGTRDKNRAIAAARIHWAQFRLLFEDLTRMLPARSTNISIAGLGLPMRDLPHFNKWTMRLKSDGEVEVSTEPGNVQDHQQALEAVRTVLAQRTTPGPVSDQTLVTPPKPAGSDSRRLSEIIEVLFEEKSAWTPATRLDYRSTLNAFIAFLGDPRAAEVDSKCVARFTTHLRSKRNSGRTIDKKLNAVASLFEIAKRDGDYLGQELPTNGHYCFTKAKSRRRGESQGFYGFFTQSELEKIFDPSVFARAKRCHEFWLPLMGLYTGARLNELCQVYLDDIRQDEEGHWFLEINDDREDQRVKTAAACRNVPLHPTLIQIGLLRYVEDLRRMPGVTRLFPNFQFKAKSGYGDMASKWFGRHLARLGIDGQDKVFHSFRKTTNQRLNEHGVSVEVRSQMIGHETDNVNIDIYTQRFSARGLGERAFPALVFPFLHFDKIRYASDRFRSQIELEMRKVSAGLQHLEAKKERLQKARLPAALNKNR